MNNYTIKNQSLSSQTSNTASTDLALLLKASGDQLRLQILKILQHDSFGVLELCNIFSIKQSAMSHHLKVLANAGLVSTRREGNAIFYRRALPSTQSLNTFIEALFTQIDQTPLETHVKQALDTTQALRELRSQAFFSINAERFKAQQELISHIDDYREGVNELLDALAIEKTTAIEIGPGDGGFLPELSLRFEHVVAADTSSDMLTKCHELINTQGITNITLIEGDTRKVAEQYNTQADTALCNMVLHHNRQPQQLIQDIATTLKKEGVLIITELCEHEQEWVRDAAGDYWLGLKSETIDTWCQDYQLRKGPSSYTALKNGFRIQILSYIKTD